MPDYTSRAEEMLSNLENIEPPPNENVRRTHREAVAKYMQTRNELLNCLVELVKDSSTSNRNNAARWTALCQEMAGAVEKSFQDEIRILATIVGPGALALGAQAGRAIQDERQFFASLSNVNAAAVRDYLIGNAQDLQTYTEGLSQAWEAIVKQTEKSHEDEADSYKEIIELVKDAARNLAEDRKTFQEKGAEVAAYTFGEISKLGETIEFLADLPEGTGKVIEKAMDWLKERTEAWASWNRHLKERMDKYLSLVQEEKGGVLPIFMECRHKVYDYWNEKGMKTSRVWLDTARSSLDSWKSSCPTSGQREDADRFSADIYEQIQQQWKTVEAVGNAFEEKWKGVFQGPLQPTTQDKLTDAKRWRQNADSLIDVRVVDLGKVFLKDADEIYGSSLKEPISKLQEAAEGLPDEHEHKGEAVQAVVALKDKIRSELGDRIKALQEQIDDARKQLEPEAIQKLFDRSEIENLLRD